ncbi:MAG: hypothetical protein QM730_02560 [Anaerolineales bacterium]
MQSCQNMIEVSMQGIGDPNRTDADQSQGVQAWDRYGYVTTTLFGLPTYQDTMKNVVWLVRVVKLVTQIPSSYT